MSWKHALTLVKEKLTEKPLHLRHAIGAIGPYADQETIPTFKNLSNTLGTSNLFIQNADGLSNHSESTRLIDFRSNHLPNSNIAHLQSGSPHSKSPTFSHGKTFDYILPIGTNPRYEASLFNQSLRQHVIGLGNKPSGARSNVTIASIGHPMDLTYPHTHLGNGLNVLCLLAQAKIPSVKEFIQACTPKIVPGISPLERRDGESLMYCTRTLYIFGRRIRTYIHHRRVAAQRQRRVYGVKTAKIGEAIPKGRYSHTIANKLVNFRSAWDQFCPLPSGTPMSTSERDSDHGVNTVPETHQTNQPRHDEHERFGIPHAYASNPGAYDSGFFPGRTSMLRVGNHLVCPSPEPFLGGHSLPDKPGDCLFLLGADFGAVRHFDCQQKAANRFVIHQGHHGDIGAKYAHVILPSTTYAEKTALHVNTEGRVRRSQQAIAIQYEGRDD